MRSDFELRWLAPIALVATAPCQAEVYFDVAQIQRALFPGQALVAQPLQLSTEQQQRIAAVAPTLVADPAPRIWRAADGGWLYIDRVIGKHDYITYALALHADGSVRQVEIMEYRESYGGQVRNPRWRKQFVGKKHGEAISLDRDIRNISGATLSCSHVTDGIRRLLALHDLAFRS